MVSTPNANTATHAALMCVDLDGFNALDIKYMAEGNKKNSEDVPIEPIKPNTTPTSANVNAPANVTQSGASVSTTCCTGVAVVSPNAR